MRVTLQAVLVSLVKVLVGVPAHHRVSGVVVDCDRWVVLLVLAAWETHSFVFFAFYYLFYI